MLSAIRRRVWAVKRELNNTIMPLIKSTSKQAFGKNIAREMQAGRPQKQAVAIAYAEKREAKKSEHHSSHSQKRSEHYHRHIADTVEPVRVDSGKTKMTRRVSPMMNDEDDTASEPEAYRG
jgi:hypothetical protein